MTEEAEKNKITDKNSHLIGSLDILLKISAMLMSSGASTYRILLIINQFATTLGFQVKVFMTHTKFIMTLKDKETEEFKTSVKTLDPIGVNFKKVSALSKASFHALNEKWSYSQIEKEIERIENLKHYPRIVILLAVSFAGAAFCEIFGGNWLNMIITFIATFFGLLSRQEGAKRNHNPYVIVFTSAFIASAIASIGIIFNLGYKPEIALATSVLFLIPGVPLVNSFTDFTEGYIINGLVRLINGLLIIFSIALGLFVAMYLFDISKI
ncbi:MAG: threonine/serine exporter ThrE family protein [Bacteroidales bacterium]